MIVLYHFIIYYKIMTIISCIFLLKLKCCNAVLSSYCASSTLYCDKKQLSPNSACHNILIVLSQYGVLIISDSYNAPEYSNCGFFTQFCITLTVLPRFSANFIIFNRALLFPVIFTIEL